MRPEGRRADRSRVLWARRQARRTRGPTSTRSRRENGVARSRQHGSHASAQVRNELALEPWIALDPAIVAPRRMGQRNELRRVFAPGCNGFRHVCLDAFAEMPGLRIRTHEQRQLEIGQNLEKALAPMLRTLLPWRL